MAWDPKSADPTFPEPIGKQPAVFIHLFKGAGDVIHVRRGAEKKVLFEPDALLTAE